MDEGPRLLASLACLAWPSFGHRGLGRHDRTAVAQRPGAAAQHGRRGFEKQRGGLHQSNERLCLADGLRDPQRDGTGLLDETIEYSTKNRLN